jgi:hypothetical protein
MILLRIRAEKCDYLEYDYGNYSFDSRIVHDWLAGLEL